MYGSHYTTASNYIFPTRHAATKLLISPIPPIQTKNTLDKNTLHYKVFSMNRDSHLIAGSKVLIVLLAQSMLCVMLLMYRIMHTQSMEMSFMVWNLFLAWIPLLAAIGANICNKQHKKAGWVWGLTSAWLLFWPNAPYLITDFVHLHRRFDLPIWYDISMFTVFAWTGLMLTGVSLYIIHHILDQRLGTSKGWLCVISMIVLCGFGVYLGRFVRLNSWDILTQPDDLISSILAPLLQPIQHIRAWQVTLVMSTIVLMIYASMRAMIQLPKAIQQNSSV